MIIFAHCAMTRNAIYGRKFPKQRVNVKVVFITDLRMTIPPLVRMRSIISEKNCLEVGGNNELEYQQLQSDDSNSSSNSDLNSPEEIKQRGKARRSTQVHFHPLFYRFFAYF